MEDSAWLRISSAQTEVRTPRAVRAACCACCVLCVLRVLRAVRAACLHMYCSVLLSKTQTNREEVLPTLFLSTLQDKKNTYTNGKKVAVLAPDNLEDDFAMALCESLLLNNGCGDYIIDFDDESPSGWKSRPLFPDPATGQAFSTDALASLYKTMCGDDGIGILRRLQDSSTLTHMTRKWATAVAVEMGADPQDLNAYMGWSEKDAQTTTASFGDSAQHYSIEVHFRISKALARQSADEPYSLVDYNLLLDVVVADYMPLVDKVASNFCGKEYNWDTFPTREDIDKMGRNQAGFTKANTQNLLRNLAIHYLCRLPRKFMEEPKSWMFQVEQCLAAQPEVTEFVKRGVEMLTNFGQHASDDAAKDAGPWAAGLSQQVAGVKESLAAIPSEAVARANAKVQAQHVADDMSNKVIKTMSGVMAALLSAAATDQIPQTPDRQQQFLDSIISTQSQTPGRRLNGADPPPPAGGDAPVWSLYKSTRGPVEKFKKKMNGTSENVSFDPKQYFHVPYGGTLKKAAVFRTYTEMYLWWTSGTLSRRSYHDMETNGSPWRKQCGNAVETFVSKVLWLMRLLTAITTRDLSEHFTEKLTISELKAAELLDLERADGHHPAGCGGTLLKHLAWLKTLESEFPGRTNHVTSHAKLEVKRIVDAAKKRKQDAAAATEGARKKRRIERVAATAAAAAAAAATTTTADTTTDA